MDEPRKDAPIEKEIPKFRGLYRYVKISVRSLDIIIGVCIAVIVIVFAIEMFSPGYTVEFDPNGGSDVASQHKMYGELLDTPEPPSREGYTFTGWYKDPACDMPWDMQTETVGTDMELYAGWQKNG